MLSPVSSQQSTVTVENYPEINSEQQESALTSASPARSSSRLGTVSQHLRGAVNAVSPKLVGGALAAASFLAEASALTPSEVDDERHRWRQANTKSDPSTIERAAPYLYGVGSVLLLGGFGYSMYKICKKAREERQQNDTSGDAELGRLPRNQEELRYMPGSSYRAGLRSLMNANLNMIWGR